MANDINAGNSRFNYEWNPFQDILENRVAKELVTVQGPSQPIAFPRCGPFFAKNVIITLEGSSTPLSFDNGDYAFLHPYMKFTKRYNNLVYGGLLIKAATTATNYEISYDTIGGDYILDDVNYAELIANATVNSRIADFESIVNFPADFPPNPHDNPMSDTYGYIDLMVAMKSYIEAIISMKDIDPNPEDVYVRMLELLKLTNMKDYPVVDENSVKGESNQIMMTVGWTKYIIREMIAGRMN